MVDMVDAVAGFGDRVWAVEGANGIGRSIAQRLVALEEVVVDVPAKLATRVRVYSTGHGIKTDQADAVAIAPQQSIAGICVGSSPMMATWP